MKITASCRLTPILIVAALLLAACEEVGVTPTPRPTRTPRPAITTNEPTEMPTDVPTQTPEPTPTETLTPPRPTPRVASAQIVNPPAAANALVPRFGPFPPVPIPNRPANINPLTGLATDPARLQRRPIVARIGNDEKVRTSFWQSGLNLADLVFEELIDQIGNAYANTRYSAVYLSNDAPVIGPIRSGRLINIQIAAMLDGALAHSGASDGTRWVLSQTPLVNLDEYFNMPAYCYNKTHGYQGRLYTTGARARQWLAQKGWEKAVPLYGFAFSEGVPGGGQPITTIALTKAPWPKWSQAEWRYDPGSGKYLRFASGAPVIDSSYSVTAEWGSGADCAITSDGTRTQIRASNVVVMSAPHEKTTIVEDSNNATSVYIPLVGQGDVLIFRDGVMLGGKWQRQSVQEFFEFVDASGSQITLKPGNTWFEIVPIGYVPDLK